MAPPLDAVCPLLTWDFENVMSDRGVSVAVGVPSDPQVISGFVSHTGGGPAELWNETGYVFLTRHLGTNDAYLWFTVTQPVFFAGLTFRHWHNHNPGYPTHPTYSVQLQLDTGDGYENVGTPLSLSNDNSGGTDTIEVNRELEPGSYKLRWHPKGLKNKARDTSSEFFAIKHLTLNGRVLAEVARSAATSVPTPCAIPSLASPAPKGKLGDFISIEINGARIEKLKVMESKYGGKCSRTGESFEAGATIAFKHRDSLTDEQKTALFGTKRPTHLMVLITEDDAVAPPVTSNSTAPVLSPVPSAYAPEYVSLEIGGKVIEHVKVTRAEHGRKCSRTGKAFAAGAIIGFKHYAALTPEERTAIFPKGPAKNRNLTVRLTDEEIAASGWGGATQPSTPAAPASLPDGPFCCRPQLARLTPFERMLTGDHSTDEWEYSNVSQCALAYSCGHLTREGHPLSHQHDPAEFALCQRLAWEASERLSGIRLNDESAGAPFVPYFATAILHATAHRAINQQLIRAVCGGALHREVPITVEAMDRNGWWWGSLVDNHWIESEHTALAVLWDQFMPWFQSVPGLRAHSFVMIGMGDDEPGAVKGRLVVALTPAGSLVGAASIVVYA